MEINKANESALIIAKELAPKKTGALADSIHIEEDATANHLQATVAAGNDDVDYATYVELGYHHHPDGEFITGQPFMLPAYQSAKRQLISALEMLGKLASALGIE